MVTITKQGGNVAYVGDRPVYQRPLYNWWQSVCGHHVYVAQENIAVDEVVERVSYHHTIAECECNCVMTEAWPW